MSQPPGKVLAASYVLPAIGLFLSLGLGIFVPLTVLEDSRSDARKTMRDGQPARGQIIKVDRMERRVSSGKSVSHTVSFNHLFRFIDASGKSHQVWQHSGETLSENAEVDVKYLPSSPEKAVIPALIHEPRWPAALAVGGAALVVFGLCLWRIKRVRLHRAQQTLPEARVVD